MSIEEKAKAYDEALERAKKLDEDGCHVLRDVFPELADSEDERIRKHLIDWLNNLVLCGNAEMIETEPV